MLPLLTNKDIVRGRLYSNCVQCSMLHERETWLVRKENEVATARRNKNGQMDMRR